MKASIIIPSSLAPRKHSATDLDYKLIRAVTSALNQDYGFKQIIIVSDGCELTNEIILEQYTANTFNEAEFKLIKIQKQPPFSGNARNAGIEAATGDIICYLDSDDILGPDHVSTIVKNFKGSWVWFNDMVWNRDKFIERECSLKLGFCGTSNIAHRRDVSSRWLSVNKYGYDDWNFIQELKKECPDGVKIETPSYIVCHIPFKRGYDV